jgi:ABC-type amino acid transport substrate-binding protein
MPLVNMPGDTELAAADFEPGQAAGWRRKLLRIESAIDLVGQKIATTLWVDEKGETLKSYVPSIQQESVRTTKEEALRPLEGGQFDLLIASTGAAQGEAAEGD